MSYAVKLEPPAREDLARLPPRLQAAVLAKIDAMASSPTRDTRPARPPYGAGMLYRADFPFEGVECLPDVVFRYGQDEQTLHVEHLFVAFA